MREQKKCKREFAIVSMRRKAYRKARFRRQANRMFVSNFLEEEVI